MKDEIEVTPELLMKAFNDAKDGIFVKRGYFTVSEAGASQVDLGFEACASQVNLGFIELKNEKKYLVSIRVEHEDEIS